MRFLFVAIGIAVFIFGMLILSRVPVAGTGAQERLPVEACFKKMQDSGISLEQQSLPLWEEKQVATVRFHAAAPSECVGAGFPFLQIENAEKANAYIQFVMTNVPDPQNINKFWNFIDKPDDLPASTPFISSSGVYQRNPSWIFLLAQFFFNMKWEALAFPVQHENKQVTALGAIKWGWEKKAFSYSPTAIKPSPVQNETWPLAKEVLSKNFPGYSYAP
jgi:hypothetical protein